MLLSLCFINANWVSNLHFSSTCIYIYLLTKGTIIPFATWDVNWQLKVLRLWIAVIYPEAPVSNNNNKLRKMKELQENCGWCNTCLTKQNRGSGTQAEAASVRWLSCYDESLRSLRDCCVPSLGHMLLLNNCSSKKSSARERSRELEKEEVTEMLCWWWAVDYCSLPLHRLQLLNCSWAKV